MSDSSDSDATPRASSTAESSVPAIPQSITGSVSKSSPPTSILMTAATQSMPSLACSSSSATHPNISFAPLPSVKPRKRHGSLGVAARSSLLAQRTASAPDLRYSAQNEGYPRSAVYVRRSFVERSSVEEDEDPFGSIGQLLSDVGRAFWRKVSPKARERERRADDDGDGDDAGAAEKGGRKRRVTRTELHVDSLVHYTLKEENEGGVWEEEVGEAAFVNAKQPSPDVEQQKAAGPPEMKVTSTVGGGVTKKLSKRTMQREAKPIIKPSKDGVKDAVQ